MARPSASTTTPAASSNPPTTTPAANSNPPTTTPAASSNPPVTTPAANSNPPPSNPRPRSHPNPPAPPPRSNQSISTPPPRSNPTSPAPPPSNKIKVSKSGSTRPLQVVVAKNAQPVRHEPFALPASETTGSKALSNLINSEGNPKLKACVQCLGSLTAVNRGQTYGRGMQFQNEVFSCLILKTKGVGGQQCARCVGLGKGNECCDPPAAAEKAARDVIAAVPAYNRALTRNKELTISEMTDAEKEAVSTAVSAAKAFNGTIDGLRKQGLFSTTPSKKRKFGDFESDSKLSDLNSALTRGQTGLESKLDSLIATVEQQGAQLQTLADTMACLDRRSIVGRGRDRWLVRGVEGIARQLNDIETHASFERSDEAPVDVNGVGDFDLNAIDQESDAETESERE